MVCASEIGIVSSWSSLTPSHAICNARTPMIIAGIRCCGWWWTFVHLDMWVHFVLFLDWIFTELACPFVISATAISTTRRKSPSDDWVALSAVSIASFANMPLPFCNVTCAMNIFENGLIQPFMDGSQEEPEFVYLAQAEAAQISKSTFGQAISVFSFRLMRMGPIYDDESGRYINNSRKPRNERQLLYRMENHQRERIDQWQESLPIFGGSWSGGSMSQGYVLNTETSV